MVAEGQPGAEHGLDRRPAGAPRAGPHRLAATADRGCPRRACRATAQAPPRARRRRRPGPDRAERGFAHAGFEVERVEARLDRPGRRSRCRRARCTSPTRLAQLGHVRLQGVARVSGGDSPHTPSISRSIDTVVLGSARSKARTSRCFGPPRSRSRRGGSRPRRPAPAPRPAGDRAPRIARRHRRNRRPRPPPSPDEMTVRVVGARSNPLEDRSETDRSRPTGPAAQGIPSPTSLRPPSERSVRR